MIRNVRDNNKQKNPYTTEEGNLRMGKFYSNRLGDNGRGNKKGAIKGFIARATGRFWS